MPDAGCAVLSCWWWTEKPSETCRASYRNKEIVKHCIMLVVLCEYIEIYLFRPLINAACILHVTQNRDLKVMFLGGSICWGINSLKKEIGCEWTVNTPLLRRHKHKIYFLLSATSRLFFWKIPHLLVEWVVLFWFDVCWCYVMVWLGWCGIRMQASAMK